jgi:hypothetical protein
MALATVDRGRTRIAHPVEAQLLAATRRWADVARYRRFRCFAILASGRQREKSPEGTTARSGDVLAYVTLSGLMG